MRENSETISEGKGILFGVPLTAQVKLSRTDLLAALGLESVSSVSNSSSTSSSTSGSTPSDLVPEVDVQTLCQTLFTKHYVLKRPLNDAHKGWSFARVSDSALRGVDAQLEAVGKLRDLIKTDLDVTLEFVFSRRTTTRYTSLHNSLYHGSYYGSYHGI